MDAVKLEGGRERADAVRAIVEAGIPVQGHLGLTPQSVHQLGGYGPQAKTVASAARLIEDAEILEQAGCFSLVLENIPGQLGQVVSQRLQIPTIGIGAGPHCDGQVLVVHDILGLFDRFTPRFAKRYGELHARMDEAIREFRDEVQSGVFPAAEHTVEMAEEEWQGLREWLEQE
jgi:3-methyl-2-oxobutanoate hydroxymethyltransferase